MPQAMEQAEDEVRVMMRARRHDAPGQPDDFEIETNDTFMDIWKQITSIFFTWWLASHPSRWWWAAS